MKKTCHSKSLRLSPFRISCDLQAFLLTVQIEEKRGGILLFDDERAEDIGEGFSVIQSDSLFKFGTDAVLLAEFAKVKKGGSVLDFCTGSGIVPLLMYKNKKAEDFEALEISEKAASMAKRTMELNGISDKIRVTCGDVCRAREIYKGRQFDLVTCNPPYMNDGGGLKNPNADKAAARHEIFCTLKDVVENASRLVRPGGFFAMVHRPHRLTDIMCLMREYSLEPKRLVLVSDSKKSEPSMVLIEGMKGAGHYLKTYTMFIKENL